MLFCQASPAGDLFFDSSGERRQPVPEDHTVSRYRTVNVDFSLLCDLAKTPPDPSGPGSVLMLNLFEDTYLTLRINGIEETFSGGTCFKGKIEDQPLSEVTLISNGEILCGNIWLPGEFYQVRYAGGDRHRVQEIDRSRFPMELPPVPVKNSAAAEKDAVVADSSAYIDVLVVYTRAARTAAGSTAAMENLIALAVSESNTGYGNSSVTQRLRLLHTAEVDYSEAAFNWSDTLSRLKETSDGYMDNVHALRDHYGADAVALIVNNKGYCGLGYMMSTVSAGFASSAFCLVSRICATGYYSFAHELGHNMGSHHDRDNASGTGAYSYSYGYQATDYAFRTIMAYNCPEDCPRLNYWSNPDVQYGGQAMGVVYTDPEAADNHRSLNNTASTVANFRQYVSSPATLSITAPNGGESWPADGTENITWNTTGSVGNVKIEYSTDDGSSWSTIVASTANDGTYSWTVPGVLSNNCRVRIGEASDGSPADMSASTFSISASTSSTMTVTSPNGGETWAGGSSQNIAWSTTGTVGDVNIRYSTDNGGSWIPIVNDTTNDGTYSWTVPTVSSSQCIVQISESDDGSPSDQSDDVFTITTSSTPTLTVTSPNGGETLESGSTYAITWSSTGSLGNVKIEYSTDGGSRWKSVVTSTPNDGSYSWTVPSESSSQCYVRIAEASDGSPSDVSDDVFTIAATGGLTVTSPNGGETLDADSTHTITWTSAGSVGYVKIEYSTDNGSSWTIFVASSPNDGSCPWVVPNVESTQCLVRISEAADGNPSDISDDVFTIASPEPPEISLNRTEFNFGALVSGETSPGQELVIENNGGGTLDWTASVSAAWLNISPASGSNFTAADLSVNASGLTAGDYMGTITITDPDADSSPQTVRVNLRVYQSGSQPFGDFSSPEEGSTVSSSVPVTGWVLDDLGVVSVKIYNGSDYVGDAILVEGARGDIQQLHPEYPLSYKAGWGYMLLSNFLPGGGNGTYTLYAKATDVEGNVVTLGSKTITVDNESAVKPFGAIDFPDQGGTASGTTYRNSGWVLTPQPNKVPEDGSTIGVYVDSTYLGNPDYGNYRSDIATLFPGYANSNGAHAFLDFDTTSFANGVHSIYWIAADNAGNADGIGSRFFTIRNSGTGSGLQPAAYSPRKRGGREWEFRVDVPGAVGLIEGFKNNAERQTILPESDGYVNIKIKELERIEIYLGHCRADPAKEKGWAGNRYEGFLVTGGKNERLPAGSTLDRERGIFYWIAGPGFLGTYNLVFLEKNKTGIVNKTRVKVSVAPRF